MITTTNLTELQKLIDSEHADPHHILGMHEIILKDKPCLSVRAYIPQAKSVTVIDRQNKEKRYPMERIHVDGFFESIISDCDEWFRYELEMVSYEGNSWVTCDPYSFQPVLSELDLYLFGEGTHYEIYNKLGAHIATADGVEGVLFAVWAPNAKRVSVIGDFNAWDGRRNPMRMLRHSGIWELFVPHLTICDRYKFEIKTHQDVILEKMDPYCNFAELRPSTTSLVFDLNKYKWRDHNWMEKRQRDNPLNGPMSIYEVHFGSWKRVYSEQNRYYSYVELARELVPYVKEMGYTHIELMPVKEHPFDGSWGYQVAGYFAPTSRYGSPDEFMYFVDECHINGLGVILDWVPAHFPKDPHGLARFDGTALYEHEHPMQGEHPDWGTLIFNYGRKEVKNFLIANALFWLEKFHIDGLRVDAVASMLYLDYGKEEGQWVPNQYGGKENLDAVEFMKHMNSVILGRYPHVLMVAEESTAWGGVSRPVEYNGLGFNLKWNMGWMNDFLYYMSKNPAHKPYHHDSLTFSMVYAHTENFVLVLSHDEVVHGKGSLINKMPGDIWQKFANLRTAYGFMYGHPGKKLMFMGGEFGQFDEWSVDKSLDWFLLDYEHHRQLQDYVKDLNVFYEKDRPLWHDDFSGGGFEWINCSDWMHCLVSFFRKCDQPGNITVFMCNFTPVPYTEHRIGVPEPGIYKEVLNSDNTKYGGSGIVNPSPLEAELREWDGRPYSIPLKVPPLGVCILKKL